MPSCSVDRRVARDVGVGEPVRQHLLPACPRGVREALPERIVDVDHAGGEPGPRKQLRLGRAVGRHRPVIVQMIAGEVGEQRDVEFDGIDAALVESVRRHFHRHRLGARAAQRREHFVHLRRVGSRVRRRPQRADEAVAEGAEHRAAATAGIEALRDPVRARRLPVRAGDPRDPERMRRAPVDEIGDRAELCLEVVDRDVGDLPRGIPVKAEGVPEDRGRAARDGVGDERAAVGRLPAIRRERIARAHLPAVGGDPSRERTQPGDERRRVEHRGLRGRHHVSSRTSLPSAGRITLSPGASAGAPSIRSADPITVEKTGAATSPP